jgi:hypothetical protein
MTLAELIGELLDRGVRLSLDEDATPTRIRWTAPPGMMTPALLEALRRHKNMVVKLLGPNRLEEPPEPHDHNGMPHVPTDGSASQCASESRTILHSHGGTGPI